MNRTLRNTLVLYSLCLCASVVSSSVRAADAPWSTYRGNAQRTGCADGKAGPAKPGVLWVYKAQDNFVASPVPLGNRLFLSGFSGFNVPSFFALDTDPKAARRVAWSKGVPVL